MATHTRSRKATLANALVRAPRPWKPDEDGADVCDRDGNLVLTVYVPGPYREKLDLDAGHAAQCALAALIAQLVNEHSLAQPVPARPGASSPTEAPEVTISGADLLPVLKATMNVLAGGVIDQAIYRARLTATLEALIAKIQSETFREHVEERRHETVEHMACARRRNDGEG